MAITKRSNGRSVQIGANPTIQQKTINVTRKLGLTGIQNQQGSAKNIFDTVALATSTGRQTLSFFNNTTNKSANFTNLQQGMLNAGESLGVQYLYFSIWTVSNSAALTADGTSVSAINPITANVPLLGATVTLTVGQSTLIDTYLIMEAHPAFNPDCGGVTNFNATAVDSLVGVTRIRLDANPIIPPGLKFKLDVSFGPITAVANTCLSVCMGRTGSIFAAKTTM